MDMLTDDATTTAILTDKSPVGIGSSNNNSSSNHLSTSQQDSDDWMRKLDKLRDMRDDEDEIRQRVGKISRQMETANAMMRVGMAEQSAVLARSDDALVRKGCHQQYRYRYESAFGQLPTMRVPVALASSFRNADVKMTVGASTKKKAAAMAPVVKSSFFNWPVPATSSKGKQVAVEPEEEESSGTSSGLDSPRECQGECCRHLTS
jgi:hypothetical protein